MNHLIKLNWLERCIQVHNFHASQVKDEPSWTIAKTADALNRSIGSVSQDLLLASWSRKNEKQLKRFSSMKDALAWVRDQELKEKLGEL